MRTPAAETCLGGCAHKKSDRRLVAQKYNSSSSRWPSYQANSLMATGVDLYFSYLTTASP